MVSVLNPTRIIPVVLAAIVTGVFSLPVSAQTDYEAIVRIMGECTKIADVPARVICYDNTINAAQLSPSSEQVDPPVQTKAPTEDRPRTIQPRTIQPRTIRPQTIGSQTSIEPTGFGAETLPKQRVAYEIEKDEVDAIIASVRRRAPGIYTFTLEGGAQWQFIETVPTSYAPPRKGSKIELRRGALGSFQMRYSGQRRVRVKRVR